MTASDAVRPARHALLAQDKCLHAILRHCHEVSHLLQHHGHEFAVRFGIVHDQHVQRLHIASAHELSWHLQDLEQLVEIGNVENLHDRRIRSCQHHGLACCLCAFTQQHHQAQCRAVQLDYIAQFDLDLIDCNIFQRRRVGGLEIPMCLKIKATRHLNARHMVPNTYTDTHHLLLQNIKPDCFYRCVWQDNPAYSGQYFAMA